MPVTHGSPWLADIDWQSPWLAPWRAVGQGVAHACEQGLALHDALNAAGTSEPVTPPVRFVAQSALPQGMPYELFIHSTGCCPVREGLHDFFNGLCWLRFPKAKARLNQLQAEQIAAHGVQAERGPVRDALTLFDENAALLQAPEPLRQALLARQWQVLFVELRHLWQQARLELFGHALLEKLTQPRKAMTAHVYLIGSDVNAHSPKELDKWLAHDLDSSKLATKPFSPLPVLGVPGWWGANESMTFYQDAQVFRSPATTRE